MRCNVRDKSSTRDDTRALEEPFFLIFVLVYCEDPSFLCGALTLIILSVGVVFRVVLILSIFRAVGGAAREAPTAINQVF
jgi:hypothetical protein